MDLSIIIISWNTKNYLYDCITSIQANTKSIVYEIIVVDNASSDDSVQMLKDCFENIVLILNKKNIGFAKANNTALPFAKGRYILMLNSDTIVRPNALNNAVKYLDENTSIGVLTPKILNKDESIQHPLYTKNPTLLSEFIEAFGLSKLFKNNLFGTRLAKDKIENVVHACGCSLFVRKEVVDEVGGLDEKLIFSYEDVDYCRRIKAKNWQIIYYPFSSIVHFGGGSREVYNNQAINYILYSKINYFSKYHNDVYVFILKLVLIFGAITKLFFVIIKNIILGKKYLKKQIIIYYLSILKYLVAHKSCLLESMD